MRPLKFLLLILLPSQLSAQLGFCEGSKGDPIFHEDFGTGTGSGSPLSSGTTSYTYVTGDPQDGEYTISSSIGTNITSWHSELPSTTISRGKALIVNADFTSGRFYKTEISGLCQNTTYEFSAYLLNIYNRASSVCTNGGIPINVRFEIWDETDQILLKEGSTGAITSSSNPQWEQYALTFQSKAGQEAIILKMFNNAEGGCGNDLAIDDIVFSSCGDLTTITSEESSSSRVDLCKEDVPASISLKATPDYSVYLSHYFQWQKSSDNSTWSDLQGETSDTYTASSITSSTYYRVKVAEDAVNLKSNLCSSASEAYFVNIIETPDAPISGGDVAICTGEPIPQLMAEVEADERVDWYDAPAGGNLLAEGTSSYTPQEEGIFYAQAVKPRFNCKPGSRTAISFTIRPTPPAEDEIIGLCDNALVTLDAGVAGMRYSWSTGDISQSISVSAEGNYYVEITSSEGCSVTKSIEVQTPGVPVIHQITSEERQLHVILENTGEFEFSIDGRNYQLSNIFESVDGGIYTAYIRDLSGCNTISEEFVHLVLPRFITPNGDGYNDVFELKGMSFFGTSEVRIFDRYGKLLISGSGSELKWNGTMNGKTLPEEDYWYDISIEGFENKKGHFSILR